MAERCSNQDYCTGDCLGCSGKPLTEQQDLLARFLEELKKPTGDGANKRAAGTKPPWYVDNGHETAMWRHLDRWEDGEQYDADSGAHPLVHAAWRALAIACKETKNVP